MRHFQPLRFVDAVARAGSIRKAAQALAINSTALNRRILSLEEELGVPIFERLPRGVRLNPAGELLVHLIRTQMSDFERLKSQIADLSGVRRGRVAMAGTRAALPHFLPEQIARYRSEHPAVTFSVRRMSADEAEEALLDHSIDLALVFEPLRRSEVQTVVSVPQRLMALMPADHPLATLETVRLRDCLQFPVGLPPRSSGVRHLVEIAAARTGLRVEPAIESEDSNFLAGHARAEGILTFNIPLGLSTALLASQEMIARPLDGRDVPDGRLYLGQLRGRALPVAAARFADQLAQELELRYPVPTRDIVHAHARLERLRHDPRLHLVRPAPPTRRSRDHIQPFNARRTARQRTRQSSLQSSPPTRRQTSATESELRARRQRGGVDTAYSSALQSACPRRGRPGRAELAEMSIRQQEVTRQPSSLRPTSFAPSSVSA